MATIGNLAVNLSLNSASFEAGMKQARASARSTEQTFNRLAGAAKLLAGSLVIREVARTAAEFEKLEASLRTVTGSADNAQAAFNGLKSFATKTPFSLQEVTNAFIKLKALGLDPSEEALISYGNTASAMGKSLNQFIEAVADAATGEFERLKEFGIKAKSQGDNVTFTFNGVATTVRKNASDIEGYLRKIGETKFAGAMDEQMGTLGGAFSNLQDSAAQLADAVGKAGLSAALQEGASIISHFAAAMTAAVDPTAQNASSISTLSEGYKVFAFTLLKVKQTFKDLGHEAMAWWELSKAIFGKEKISDVWNRLVEERRQQQAQLEQEAEQFVARMNGIMSGEQAPKIPSMGGAPATSQGEDEAAAKKLAKEQERLAAEREAYQEHLRQRFESLNQSLITEQERLALHYEENRILLEDSYVNGIIPTEQALKEQLELLEADHQEKLTEIARREAEKRVEQEKWASDTIASMKQNVFMQAVGLLRSFAGESKAAAYAVIAIEKGLAIAEASMNTAVAITKALTIDPTGALASRVATLGAIQIGLIAATGIAQASQVGAGGASLGSVANPVYTTSDTGGQSISTQQEVVTQRFVTLNVGDAVVMDKNGVRALIGMINEEIGDGVKLAVA